MGAKNVVDVGVFTGCSALAAVLAIPPNGRVYALDVCEEFVNVGKPFFEQVYLFVLHIDSNYMHATLI